LQAACMMLDHLELSEKAALIRNAWLRTIEDGIHTADIYRDGFSIRKVGTSDFTAAVIERLGQKPAHFQATTPVTESRINIPAYNRETSNKVLVGADIFVDWTGADPEVIGTKLINLSGPSMKLKMITNRGVKVFPGGLADTFCTDHWRCRFVQVDAVTKGEDRTYPEVEFSTLLDLQSRLSEGGIDIIKTENLYEFDGERGFSLGQGE
ncbi:MAG: isocitrate/isopropylmalate family dehydrogenase, partial [Bacteroidota bacterium]